MRFSLRQLRRSPGFALSAVLTLALGIGANATIFTWMQALVLNPLPAVPDSQKLHGFQWRTPEGNNNSFSWPEFVDYRAENSTLSGLAVMRMTPMSLGTGSQPERVWGMLTSGNYFDVAGVAMARGRAFRMEEELNLGGTPVAVLSHALWRDRFQSDPSLVGRTIQLNGRAFEVIGIAPEGFHGTTLGLKFDVFVPLGMRSPFLPGSDKVFSLRGSNWLDAIARLKPGVPLSRAQADLTAISARLAREHYKSGRYKRAEITPVWRYGAGKILAPVMLLMMAVVGVVLLIACANVANLLLARAAGRRREIAIRLALGVNRGRLIRQLLAESLILAMAGGLLALVMARLTAGLMIAFLPPNDLPMNFQAPVDWPVAAFTLGVATLASLLFGLAPALRASRPDVVVALKDESGASAGAGKARLRNGLVVAQVAMSVLLLVFAGLLLKSLGRAAEADPGFDPRNVLLASIDLFPNGYDAGRGRVFLGQVVEKLQTLPGVAAVSMARRVPLGLGGTSSSSFEAEGYTPAKDEQPLAYLNNVGPDYLRTIGTPLVAGRDLTPADRQDAPPAVVVNETMAKQYYGGNAVGKRINIHDAWRVIVGVAKDSKYRGFDEKPAPFVYLPVLQAYLPDTTLMVRTTGEPLAAARAVEAAIHELNPALPVFSIRTMESNTGGAYIAQRMGGSMLAVFGMLALVLAAVGLYGVLAYSMAQRSREVGIRMALGATSGDVLRIVIRHGLAMTLTGIGIGLGASLALTRLIKSMLYGVSPTDGVTLAGVAAMLIAVALVACYLPARRAMRIDPVRAMRHD
ncbi:MAG: ABC transporter permease [Bryobacteraceae bacterium]|nr:ABC transporter permease [Bryobacteraceae bacterium]